MIMEESYIQQIGAPKEIFRRQTELRIVVKP
jgi:hypothetical protein